jgi:hypothetical protein
MGMFDDLIPTKTSGGMFDDLIPAKPTPQQNEAAVVQPPTEAELREAASPAIITKAPMPSRAKIEEAKKKSLEASVPFEDIYKKPEIFSVVKDYMKVRLNVEQGKDQTDEDFAKDFMARMRFEEYNTFLGLMPTLAKMRSVNPKEAEAMAFGKELYKQTRSVFQPGGQGYGSADALVPYWNTLTSFITDPLSYVGFVGGKVAGQVVKISAAQEAAQLAAGAAAKGKIASLLTPTKGKAIAGLAGIETASGALQSKYSQQLDQMVAESLGKDVEELSVTQMAVSGIINGVFGGLEAKAAVTKFGKTGTKQFEDLIKKAKDKTPKDFNAPPTKTEAALLTPVDENMDLLAEEFMKQEGAKILDEISPAAALVEPAIRRDLSQRAIRVAMNVIENDPTYKVKAGQKTSTAIAEVFSAMDQGLIDDTLLEQAIRKEGLSPEQFAQANRVTVTQAAQIMQQYSTASKTLNRLRQIDPDVAKQVDALYGAPDEYTSTVGRVMGAFLRAERESKAVMVSGIGTSVRNGIGTGTGLTLNSAASLIEGTLMTVGKTLSGDAKGARIATLKTSIADTVEKAFGSWYYLSKGDLSSVVTDKLLEHNPSLRNNILSSMQEDSTDLSKFARFINSLNVAQDAIFRKAIFAHSVETKLKDVGLDMYELLAQGKVIPADVLKEAADDTLKATFSYMPKVPKKGINTFEAKSEKVGNYIVKAIEDTPFTSLIVPFPRFMANAIAFQYRYSPLGGIAGAESVIRGSKMIANGDEGGASLVRKGQENIAKGIVGTSALIAAIDYRANNQDVEWFEKKNDDNTTTDLRGLFPLGGVTLAAADLIVKQQRGLSIKVGGAIEALIGMKLPAGTQTYLVDQIISAVDSERDTDKLSVALGRVIGDFIGRFTTPFIVKDIFNFVDAIREGGSIARDPNVVTSDKPADKMLEAMGNRLKSKIPGDIEIPPLKVNLPSGYDFELTKEPTSIGKESLPEAIPRVKQGPIYKEGEYFNNLVGVRITPEKTPEEIELIYLGIDPYKLYGPPSGDKEYDRAFVEEANPVVIAAMQRAMMDPRYSTLPDIEQKKAIENTVSEALLEVARPLTAAKFMQKDLNRIYKMEFNKLPADTRKIINNRYAAENNGKTLEEANDYMKVPEYKTRIKDLKFATGGIVAGKLFKAGAKAATTGTEGMLELIRKTKNPEALVANEINNIVEKNLDKADLTTKAIPTQPAAKKSKPSPVVSEPKPVDAEMEKLVSDAEASFTPPPKVEAEVVPEIKTELPMEAPTPMTPFMKGIVESDLNKAKYGFSKDSDIISDFEVRQNTLTAIKQIRTDAFDKLIEMPNVAGKVEDDVIAVAQGEYRAAKGKEVDVNDPKSVEDFVSFSMPLQDKLNKLREKYKDRPPKVLYHGTPYNAEERATKGFFDPQTLPEDQAGQRELKVGATSFTSDARFNYSNISFGGTNPENIVQTSIPYADYEFRRINMSRDQYKKKVGIEDMGDMNTIARSITGSPTVARPLGLPRSIGMKESEDAFTESEKLAISRNMYETEKKTPLFNQQEEIFRNSFKNLQELKKNFLSPKSLKPIKEGGLGSEEVQALKAYRLIRGLIRNEFRETGGKAASEAGFKPIVTSNQTTASRLNRLSRPSYEGNLNLSTFIPDVIESLEKVGSKDKAEALKVLEKQFNMLRKINVDSSSPNVKMSAAVEKEIEAVNNIRDLVGGDYRDKETKKRIGLAKGGLASRR